MSAFQVGHEHINALLHFHRHRQSPARSRPTELRVYRPTHEGCVALEAWAREGVERLLDGRMKRTAVILEVKL